MRRIHHAVSLGLLLGSSVALSRARADEAYADETGASLGEESPELRALRELAERTFPASQGVTLTPADFAANGPEVIAASELSTLTLPDIPVRLHPHVLRWLKLFRDDPRAHRILASWLERTTLHGDLIRNELRALGLPEDIQYLAMIESGFDPTARSEDGAVGIWQLLAAPAAQYGLLQNHWIDERRSPEASTRAGAGYLRDLKERFGTWELAFAAYNMGYPALMRSIRKYNTNDFWALSSMEAGLPYETVVYVARVMATAIIGRNPATFGFDDVTHLPASESTEVEVAGAVSLAKVARTLRLTEDALAKLNPELLRGRTPPGDTYRLRVPASSAAAMRSVTLAPELRDYVVRFGEDLATLAKRHRTTVSELRQINDLGSGSRVRAGVRLLVPTERTLGASTTVAEPPSRPTVAVKPLGLIPSGRRLFYRTIAGDTLSEVAAFFGVTLENVRTWNTIDPRARLQAGQVLQLFVANSFDVESANVMRPEEVSLLVTGSEEFLNTMETAQNRVRARYTVAAGDTMSGLATRFGLSIGSIARINQFPSDRRLIAGEVITVYVERELWETLQAEPIHASLVATNEVTAATGAGMEEESETESPRVSRPAANAIEQADAER